MIWLLLAACYDEARFQAEYDHELCAWKAECHGLEDVDACEAEAAAAYTSPAPACTFQAEPATACVEGVEELECSSGDLDPTWFPQACAEVWDCG